jgi:hypothetical protein
VCHFFEFDLHKKQSTGLGYLANRKSGHPTSSENSLLPEKSISKPAPKKISPSEQYSTTSPLRRLPQTQTPTQITNHKSNLTNHQSFAFSSWL